MTDSSEHQSGFWTLSRGQKMSKRRNSDLQDLHHKVFNISVVGLSGTEKDKGPLGIGKSCLCNRFVRSGADDYHTDHISVLSQSDFGGRVVNNDHWLYWGSVIKTCDGYDLAFNVIEQSEFVDDACFQPFKSGKTEPYVKRCANTKLVSAEKLMYICKSQLGIEREYEQRYLPDGKFNVDGFLCLFDVSNVQGRRIDKQIEMTNLIMLNLIKTKKPVVFVTTKHDEASELLVIEAERLVNQRDFRGLVPIVETSAQENVNINMAFLVCAQLIDKTRAKLRVPSYFEAYKNHLDLLNAASDAYSNLIRMTVIDHRSSWQQVCIKLSHNPEFLQYTYLHGLEKAATVFKNHLKQIHDECIYNKVQNYLKIFPALLNDLAPRVNPININNNNNSPQAKSQSSTKSSIQSWDVTKEQLRSHPLFNKHFIQIPPGISWHDTELLQSSDNRIPSDWLDSDEAHSIFQQRNLLFETEERRQQAKDLFAQMLSNIKIPVGKPFIELKHIFTGNANLEILNDQELFEVYVEFQNNLLQRARADFQELLLENAEHLHHLTSNNQVIRQDDIKTINAILQHDERYQALDGFDQDRTLMMIRHLSFIHSQISEQCPSYPRCVEPEVERLLITKAKNLVSRYFETKQDDPSAGLHSQKTCDLVIFGPRRPSQQLILALNVLNSRAPKISQYQITFTVFDNTDEVDTQIQRFTQSNAKPKGCFGIFTNQRSLEHVDYTLRQFLALSYQTQGHKKHFGSPPIVMLYAADITLDERTMLTLENEGQQMADRFKCPFMNVTAIDQYRQHQQNNILNSNDQDSASQMMSECASLDYACVDAAFNVLKEAISRRVCFMELYNNQDLIPRQAFNPDARILMCLLCGEPFSNEHFMWKMFLDYEDCYVTSSKSICLKIRLENGQDKFIEITITSYTHGAFNYREDLLHGFILVCSIERKASLSILNAFSFNIPCTPVLILAIRSDVRLNDQQFNDRESDSLIGEARSTANRLKGHFELLDIWENQKQVVNNTHSVQRIRNFLQNVIKQKPTIEKAYELGDCDISALPSSSNYDNPHLSAVKTADPMTAIKNRACLRTRTNTMSSDDDPSDQKSVNDRIMSDESENSNSAPPKPVRFSRSDREGHQRADKTKSSHASEETNDSHSGNDTEDSTDNKQDKPKPGKLDLSQFDNITNAIGKLNVQTSTMKPPEISSGAVSSKKFATQVLQESAQESGFFKNRTRKVKSRAKESLQRDSKESSGSTDQFASFKDRHKEKRDRTGSIGKQEATQQDLEFRFQGLKGQRRSSENIEDPQLVADRDVKDRSSQLKNKPNKTTASSFLRGQEPELFERSVSDLPRPAPRTNQIQTKPSPSPAVTSFTGSAAKRIQNPRQNHGRAVAPPMLPNSALLSSSANVLDCEPSDELALANETVGEDIDFSQSPITQRLLKHTKDHKVSELNSPYGSDCELSQSTNVLRGHKLYRGQSLGSENNSPGNIFMNSSVDSSELINSRGAAIRQLNEILANKQRPGGRPGGQKHLTSRSSSLEQEQQPQLQQQSVQPGKKNDKDSKKDKKKLRDDEKLEKRRLKEEERLRKQEKKLATKKSKAGSSVSGESVGDDGVPLFIKRCIEFIESEGLDAEGIYRVPGNRAHVDAFVQKFKENPDMSIIEYDIPVNAVATALKDFLSKKWGPIIPLNLMNELTELSNITEKEQRIQAVRQLVKKLPLSNYKLLKYVFSHFVKVSINHSLNSMDSKNLAICWWPTLLPLHFNDMIMFEQMRPHLEESIQTMIDEYDYIFDSEEPTSNAT